MTAIVRANERVHSDSNILQLLTTEHFALQTARAATTTEANGRTSLFMNAVAASVLATAFVGQTTPLGVSLYGFILVAVPVVIFLGLVTFVRLLDTSMYDMSYALRIKRLREFYTELAPEFRDLLSPTIDEDPSRLPGVLGGPFWWRSLLSSAGIVEVVNSTLFGAFVGLVLAQSARWPPAGALPTAVATFALALLAHLYYQILRWRCARQLGA